MGTLETIAFGDTTEDQNSEVFRFFMIVGL